ncbi:unnamed protein product [Rotaria magnacalcarata]|uniref:Methyltransferase type 11 domain-containing protein n=3 Tax=Rotaria magnacalcarata TaxID=392030 RepID=A0A816GVX1_9BILA|nr:unnamed protein product [Rotaria magnacalcarata]CAF4161396.1 unnamed protein product [Rotaria magnacalcarata]
MARVTKPNVLRRVNGERPLVTQKGTIQAKLPAILKSNQGTSVSTNLCGDLNEEVALTCYKIQVDGLWAEESVLLLKAYLEVSIKHQLNNSQQTIRILDVGCGTGELLTRLIGQNGLFEQVARSKGQRLEIYGVELDKAMCEFCKQRLNSISVGAHVSVTVQNACATKLPFEPNMFDIVMNRHMLHSVPRGVIPDILKESYRVLKSDGIIHFVAEDIEMIYTSSNDDDKIEEQHQLWSKGIYKTGAELGVDLRIGRKLPAMLNHHDFIVRFVKFACVDTCSLNQQSLVSLFQSWRSAFANGWQKNKIDSDYDVLFNNFINVVQDKQEYACWSVPIMQAVKRNTMRHS